MLKFDDTVALIYSTERSIRDAEAYENNHEQKEYAEHLKNLLKLYIKEHRQAAEREGKYAIR